MLVPFDPSQFESESATGERPQDNKLVHYLRMQPPELLSQIAQSVTPDVHQMIAGNIQGLMGSLPSSQFNIQISTNRDNLSALLASAMMTGYFLRNVEQRMELEGRLNAALGGED
ncbi:MAG: DUF760 domain-containing protein [Aphanocapsa lilacina HA4352-LM1]|nr:DUF760 domain-containing protein [Aphanocapsa lilacina HA4352-LM1]